MKLSNLVLTIAALSSVSAFAAEPLVCPETTVTDLNGSLILSAGKASETIDFKHDELSDLSAQGFGVDATYIVNDVVAAKWGFQSTRGDASGEMVKVHGDTQLFYTAVEIGYTFHVDNSLAIKPYVESGINHMSVDKRAKIEGLQGGEFGHDSSNNFYMGAGVRTTYKRISINYSVQSIQDRMDVKASQDLTTQVTVGYAFQL